MGSVTALDVGRPSLAAPGGYVMGFWCVPVAAQCSIYRRGGGRGGGGEPGAMAAPVAARTNPLLRPCPVGMPLVVGSTRLHGNRPCVRGPRSPARLPAYLGPEPGSARQNALPEGGGRRGRLGGLRAERSNTLFACRNGSVGRGGGRGRGGQPYGWRCPRAGLARHANQSRLYAGCGWLLQSTWLGGREAGKDSGPAPTRRDGQCAVGTCHQRRHPAGRATSVVAAGQTLPGPGGPAWAPPGGGPATRCVLCALEPQLLNLSSSLCIRGP